MSYPLRTSVRNSRTYRVKPCKTNRCHDTFINKCPSIFQLFIVSLRFYVRSCRFVKVSIWGFNLYNYVWIPNPFLYIVNLSNSVDTVSEVFQWSILFYFILFYSRNRSYREMKWGIDFTAWSFTWFSDARNKYQFLGKRKPLKKYRKIPKISQRAYIFQRPFLRGLFLEGLICGGKFAFQNRLG